MSYALSFYENIIYYFRKIGSDISARQILIDNKTQLGPPEIALLRSVGCEEVCVYK